MMRRQLVSLLLAGAALLPLSCGPSDTVTIQGAGATFPAPLYQRWFLEYYLAHPNVRVNYQSIGSGAGVSQLQEDLTDFAASDEALNDKKLKEVAQKLTEREHLGKNPVELIQIPFTAGAIALCYNLPGNPDLELPRKVYVGMVLGEISYWDDPAIKEANPGVSLPHLKITFIRRADSSGTTFVFTNHLNAIDDRWKTDNGGPGVSKTPQWKVGIGGKGNAGVAALISQTPGAFGYIEAGYAELVELKMAKLENHAGHFVLPTNENCRVALEEAKFDDVFGATIPDPKGKTALKKIIESSPALAAVPGTASFFIDRVQPYPIVTFTWVIVRKHYADKRLGDNLRAVLSYCLEDEPGKGQALSKDLGYVALPKETLERARKEVQKINAEPENEPSK
jgi:phosphate transport system substrate-binding protein